MSITLHSKRLLGNRTLPSARDAPIGGRTNQDRPPENADVGTIARSSHVRSGSSSDETLCFIASMDGLYGFPRPRRVRVVQRVRLRFEVGLTLPPTLGNSMHAFVTGATDERRFHSPCVLRFLPFPSCPSRCTPSSRLCVMHRRAATATTRWPSTLSLE